MNSEKMPHTSLTHMGELCGVFSEFFGEKLPQDIKNPLYSAVLLNFYPCIWVPLMITGMEILIDLLYKSRNAPVPYPTVHNFVTEMYTFLLQNGALWDIHVMHCGICEMDLLMHEITLISTIIRHNTSHHSSIYS